MVGNPLPQNLTKEIALATKIMEDFTMPSEHRGIDKVIPKNVIANCRGVCIMSVFKIGFLMSARGGSGIVLCKLNNGSWSAPAAIATTGIGGGFQIGAELTDFVLILNTNEAVKGFSKGNVTLGGNLSVALGPLGRNTEASATMRSMAAVYTYSKTKGLFAGISLEGSGIIQRPDANKKFYGRELTTAQIFEGCVDPPLDCQNLYRLLSPNNWSQNSFSSSKTAGKFHEANNSYARRNSDSNEEGSASREPFTSTPRASAYMSKSGYNSAASSAAAHPRSAGGSSSSAYHDRSSSYDRPTSTSFSSSSQRSYQTNGTNSQSPHKYPSAQDSSSSNLYSKSNDSVPTPSFAPPTRPRPSVPSKPTAKALYDFEAQQDGDLGFRAGDIIIITKKTLSSNDWWEGECKGKRGSFPANYVSMC
eukprot:Sdes_comp20609_c0_seq1m15636